MFTLPKWYDLHVHLRQGAGMKAYVQAQIDMACAGVLAMPNTKPPIIKVTENDPADGWSIENYIAQLEAAGGDEFDQLIVPLYLSQFTTPKMIEDGAKTGFLRAAKYYPPHGTTNAGHSRPAQTFIENGVFEAMADNGVVLCTHGEEHDLTGDAYFGRESNAEEQFYRETMPRIADAAPSLKIVAEHITTKVAADWVHNGPDTFAATVTPQHLLYSIGDLIQGLKYHLYCLPVLKFDTDQKALLDAVTAADNTQFFAGTDSAPHTTKATPCGCAAGCFTGGFAPQLYAEAFELNGIDMDSKDGQQRFIKFLSTNGPDWYGFAPSSETFSLGKQESVVEMLETEEGPVTPLTLGLGRNTLPWTLSL